MGKFFKEINKKPLYKYIDQFLSKINEKRHTY